MLGDRIRIRINILFWQDFFLMKFDFILTGYYSYWPKAKTLFFMSLYALSNALECLFWCCKQMKAVCSFCAFCCCKIESILQQVALHVATCVV